MHKQNAQKQKVQKHNVQKQKEHDIWKQYEGSMLITRKTPVGLTHLSSGSG